MPQTSPTLRRWELARRLRQLREAAGLNLEDVAAELLCSPSKISRIETAARGASARDVRDLSRIYEVDPATQDYLMRLAREAKERGWWQRYDEVLPDYTTFMGLEAAASSIQSYDTIIIPGLLQIPAYSVALTRRLNLPVGADAADQYARSRQERQKRLQGPDAPSYWVILDEAVLHRQVGGPTVMRDQIHDLAQRITERQVILQIIPFTAGAHAGMEGDFAILGYDQQADMPDLVYLEGRAGQLFLSREADLKYFRDTFDHLRAAAESPDDSLDHIRQLLIEGPK
jgi:transcriptional regulator with XRE-family HTH domain